ALFLSTKQIQEENLWRGNRKKETSVRLRDYVTNTIKKTSPSRSTPPAESRSLEREPVTYYEASKDKCWRSTMDSKLEALEHGTIERFKARLVILENQVEGINYNETFAPVSKMVIVRVFLAVAAIKQWELHQMDVHIAFLHGDLEEEVFMKLSRGSNKEAIETEREPVTYYEASKDKCWRSAMDSKLEALERNQTWTIKELPSNKKALGCKWVYKIKYKSDGTIERFKAQLVILENQVEGINYNETFAPVSKMVIMRVFLAVAAIKQWELHQMDVHIAFLHGDLEEEVFMKLSRGSNKGCPLIRRSLIGWLVYQGDSPVSWKTNRQHTILRSSAEAEYQSMALTTDEPKWLKGILKSLGLRKKYHLSLKNDMPPQNKMDDPNITLEEHRRLEEEKAQKSGKVINWEAAKYCKIWKHFKTLSLDESRSPNFDLFYDQEEYSKEKFIETMAETMEEYMSKTQSQYGLGVARPKIEDKDNFELIGQFLKELRTNTFSGSDHEDANEHIEKVLEIVDLIHIPNVTIDQVMLRAFPMSLTGAASHWLRNKPSLGRSKNKVSKQILPTCSYYKENRGDQQVLARTG
nr:retrovirus-related Pol polyprotein from transposon TNT 1-94 [Tanacetum cinerariifolium]